MLFVGNAKTRYTELNIDTDYTFGDIAKSVFCIVRITDSSDINIYLPDSYFNYGKSIYFKLIKSGTGDLYIHKTGGDKIDRDRDSVYISDNGSNYGIVSDKNGWHSISFSALRMINEEHSSESSDSSSNSSISESSSSDSSSESSSDSSSSESSSSDSSSSES